jgi:hypothetical protein
VRSPIAGLFVALSITAIAASAAPAPLSKLAPADEYFGRMKMSFLGMNNTFRDAAISSGAHTTDPGIIHKVALAEEALEAWGRKYPHDTQLARTYFLATQVDRKIWVKANQDRAWIYLNRLVELFPTSYFGKLLKRDLAIGFTEHYYALAVPCATPTPAPTPTASPTDDASGLALEVQPDVTVTDTPAPTPTPSPSSSPGPTETTLAKGLKVEILPQACVPPPTPSPSPSPSPSATPSPAESASPSPAPSASAMPDVTPAPLPTPS